MPLCLGTTILSHIFITLITLFLPGNPRWCPRPDSNRYVLRHLVLNQTSLPISSLGHKKMSVADFYLIVLLYFTYCRRPFRGFSEANKLSGWFWQFSFSGGPSRIRTDNPLGANEMLSQLELWAHNNVGQLSLQTAYAKSRHTFKHLQQFITKKPLPNKANFSSPLPRPTFPLRGIGNLPLATRRGFEPLISSVTGWRVSHLHQRAV